LYTDCTDNTDFNKNLEEIAAIKIAAIEIASVASLLRNDSFFQAEQRYALWRYSQ
jgi:hypothetical protein